MEQLILISYNTTLFLTLAVLVPKLVSKNPTSSIKMLKNMSMVFAATFLVYSSIMAFKGKSILPEELLFGLSVILTYFAGNCMFILLMPNFQMRYKKLVAWLITLPVVAFVIIILEYL